MKKLLPWKKGKNYYPLKFSFNYYPIKMRYLKKKSFPFHVDIILLFS